MAKSLFVLGNNVYIAGNEDRKIDDNFGTYWRNGVPTTFNTGKVTGRVISRSIAVSGDNIHIVGNVYTNEGDVGFHWKNGTSTNLDPKSLSCEARSIVIRDEEVYIGGFATNNKGKTVAQYWKNGIPIPVKSNPNSSSQAFCIFIETYL